MHLSGLVIEQPEKENKKQGEGGEGDDKHGRGEEKDRLGPLLGSNQSLASQESRHNRY